MKQLITKNEVVSEVKNAVNLIMVLICMAGGCFITNLIFPSKIIWMIILTMLLLVILPAVLLIWMIYDRKKDMRIFKEKEFFLVKKSMVSRKFSDSDASDNGTVYKRYLYDFGKYGKITLEEGTHIGYNESESVFFLLIWGKERRIKKVFPAREWDIDENDFEKSGEEYHLK